MKQRIMENTIKVELLICHEALFFSKSRILSKLWKRYSKAVIASEPTKYIAYEEDD